MSWFVRKYRNFAALNNKSFPYGVLFNDPHLLVLDKPAGITVIPERNGVAGIQQMAEQQFGKLFTIHRIDKETSGIVVFAKNPEAHRHLSMQFESHAVNKKYTAFVQGMLPKEEVRVEKSIGPHPRKPNVMIISNAGKQAVSVFKPGEIFKHVSVAEVEIKTGRTHQVRLHMQYAGFPLLVDAVYGVADSFYLSAIKGKYKGVEKEKPLLARLSLHASDIGFLHPENEKQILITSTLPADLQLVLKMLRKYDTL